MSWFALPVHEKGIAKVQAAPVAADQAIQLQAELGLGFESGVQDIYAVPPGSRLVIQYVQAYVNFPTTDSKPEISLRTTIQGTAVDWAVFTPHENLAAAGYRNFGGVSPVTIYADGATSVGAYLGSAPTASADTVGFVAFSGLLQAAP